MRFYAAVRGKKFDGKPFGFFCVDAKLQSVAETVQTECGDIDQALTQRVAILHKICARLRVSPDANVRFYD